MRQRIVVGISGASGAPYAERLLDVLAERAGEVEVHLVFSKYGRVVWGEEVGRDPREYGLPIYAPGDMTAPFASGSAGFDAMVVVPCSAGALSRAATGVSVDLLGRAADVMLKERRKLVLVLRESPYSLVLVRNMVRVTEAGAVILPASPSFYSHPADRRALLDTVTARILDQLGLENRLMERWSGRLQGPRGPARPSGEEVG